MNLATYIKHAPSLLGREVISTYTKGRGAITGQRLTSKGNVEMRILWFESGDEVWATVPDLVHVVIEGRAITTKYNRG